MSFGNVLSSAGFLFICICSGSFSSTPFLFLIKKLTNNETLSVVNWYPLAILKCSKNW